MIMRPRRHTDLAIRTELFVVNVMLVASFGTVREYPMSTSDVEAD